MPAGAVDAGRIRHHTANLGAGPAQEAALGIGPAKARADREHLTSRGRWEGRTRSSSFAGSATDAPSRPSSTMRVPTEQRQLRRFTYAGPTATRSLSASLGGSGCVTTPRAGYARVSRRCTESAVDRAGKPGWAITRLTLVRLSGHPGPSPDYPERGTPVLWIQRHDLRKGWPDVRLDTQAVQRSGGHLHCRRGPSTRPPPRRRRGLPSSPGRGRPPWPTGRRGLPRLWPRLRLPSRA